MNKSVIQVIDLTMKFGGLVAINNLSLSIDEGKVTGLVGPNGSGKSTLFNILTGVLRATSGKVILNNKNITHLPTYKIARLGVARTFQIPSLFSNMTVYENIAASTVQSDWKNHEDISHNILDILELDLVKNVLARDLSGGQQRLLEMARIMARKPDLVLLDEVAAGVHPTLRQVIIEAIKSLSKSGTSILLIEHDMEMTQAICDTFYVMDMGNLIASGDFETVTSDPKVIEAYLGA